MKIIIKPIRKYINVVIIPNIVFNNIRIILYRFCGFKIGRNVFIGMKCYLDDLCYDKILIEDNVTISYGVFFACHGKNQSHTPIVIKRGAYIGMRASIISTKHGICLGENSVVGACALVNKDIPDNAMAVGIPIRIIQK
ncbi:MAG: acyltransferase [Treponema sp.]|nr:acyltransferase [Treponema sp.]MCL2193899.1 acyltransferase [Treponema sp.]